MAGSVRILKTTGEEFDFTELESELYGDPPAQFDYSPMYRKPRNIHGLSPVEVMALLASKSNSELPYSAFPNPYELDLPQHGFSEPEFDPMQAHLDEEDARRKLKEGVEPPSKVFMSEDLRYPAFRRTSPRRYDDPPNPFKKGSPLDVAWALLKALPEQQQYTDLPALGESFGQPVPQHRVGTVHPAIRGMLERYRNATQYDRQGNPVGLPPENMRLPAVLRTTGTSPSNPPVPRTIEAHPGRSGMPYSRDYEIYGDDYGQSPQFLDTGVMGVYDAGQVDAHAAPMVAGPHRIIQTQAPPKGSQQAMIDEIYAQRPSIAERAFR